MDERNAEVKNDRPVSRAMSGACVVEYGRLVGNDGGRYLAVEGLVGAGRIEFTVEMASHIAVMLAEAQDHPGYNDERAHVRDCWSDVEPDDDEDWRDSYTYDEDPSEVEGQRT